MTKRAANRSPQDVIPGLRRALWSEMAELLFAACLGLFADLIELSQMVNLVASHVMDDPVDG
jgi:hypothetical protein